MTATYSKAYRLAEAITALENVSGIWEESEALTRMKGALSAMVLRMGITDAHFRAMYNGFVQERENARVLERIERGDIDWAIVKFPQQAYTSPITKLSVMGYGMGSRLEGDPLPVGTYDVYPQYKRPAGMVSIRMDDAQAMLTMWKDHNSEQLSGGAVGMSDDLELAERVEAAIDGAKGTTTGRDWTEDFGHENGNYQCKCVTCSSLFFGHKRRVICKVCDQKPTKVASVVICKGGIEQIIFNLGHGLPDGVYELVQP